MLNYLMNSPIVWLILTVISVIGFIQGIISKKKKKISFDSRSSVIVKNNNIDGLDIHYKGTQVNTVTITNFAIWNSGNSVIKKDDLTSQKLRIRFEKSFSDVLSADIISKTENENKVKIVSFNKDEIVIDFDYMNPKDGVIIQVIHSGEWDPYYSSVELECILKGSKSVKKSIGFKTAQSHGQSDTVIIAGYISSALIILFTILLILFTLFVRYDIIDHTLIDMSETDYNAIKSNKMILYMIMTGLSAIIYAKGLFDRIKNRFKLGIPNKLKKKF